MSRQESPAVEEMPEPELPDAEPPAGALDVIEKIRPPLQAQRPIPSDDEIRRLWRIGGALAQSGMFPDAKEAGQAFAKILMGHDLGLSPSQAMTGIHIVEGKPQLHYATMGGFIKARPGYDYRVEEHSEQLCRIIFLRDGEEIGESSFSIEEAQQRNLVKARGNWEKMPKVMLLARALSQGVRWYMPEVLGGIPVYVEGEIERGQRQALGSGEAVGLELGPKVEEVLIRAKSLGHEGIASRATAEMALGDQPPAVVDQWVASMHAELDAIDPAAEQPDEEPEEAPDGEEEVSPADVEQPEEAKGDE